MPRLGFRPRAAVSSAAAAALAALLWIGCSDSPIAPSGSTAGAPEARPSVGPPPVRGQDLGPALAAQRRHTASLLAMKDVVGTAVGLTDTGEPTVKLFTLRPGVAGLPAELDGVPVTVEVTGMFVAGSDPTTRARPAPTGYSVGHPSITAGTIGARVVDGSGALYILSNNHVLAASNNASIGDAALQPGPFDGGQDPADRVGTLADFQVIDFSLSGQNTMDAAIAATTADDVGHATPTDDGYGAPSATPFDLDGNDDGRVDGGVLGLAVHKYGRTTGHTHGTIAEINVNVEVCYEVFLWLCLKSAIYVDQLGIAGANGSFSGGGDSGSLIVTDDGTHRPVALLFAGSSTRTIGNRIDLVLQRFGVSVDDGSGSGGGTSPPPPPPPPENQPPTASFTHACADLACDFDGTGSSDSDGTIQAYDWDFGDGNGGSGATPSHTYGTAGTYTVTLIVTDDDEATSDPAAQDVSVSEPADPPAGEITFTATGRKVKGQHVVDLAWTNVPWPTVHVFRDLLPVGSTDATDPGSPAGTGTYTDFIGAKGKAEYIYFICEGTGLFDQCIDFWVTVRF